MPIYAYRCENCGHEKDVLQRIADSVLTVCSACGQATLRKQLTAAGFQLKGSGWYVTDFRGDKAAARSGDSAGEGADKANGDALKPGAPGAPGASASKTEAAPAASPSKTEAAPAATPAPPPAAPSGGKAA